MDLKEPTDTDLTSTTDITEQLLHRYSTSSAPHHIHLLATAAATRSILQSQSLPLTPLSYFFATISHSHQTKHDPHALSALSSFLSIILPLLPQNSIPPVKASKAVCVVVEMVEMSVGNACCVRGLVKCLGVLTGFCDLEDWSSVRLGFQTLLKFSIDKRPKVRKSAQDCILKVFKSFESSTVIKKASKLVYSFLLSHMPLAIEISSSRVVRASKVEILSKTEHLEVLHMLNVLKHTVPHLSAKVSLKVLTELQKLMSSKFSALTRHNFDIIEAMHETSKAEVVIPQSENIINSLASFISVRSNPMDTVLSAANLLKSAFDKLHASESINWIRYFPLVLRPIAGLLLSEVRTATEASKILQELINRHIDRRNLLILDNQPADSVAVCNTETTATLSVCNVFDNVLSACVGIPNEHILAVLSVLFLKLGEISYFYMKGIVLKLSELMTIAMGDTSDTKHLQECIGSAIIAMGPEKFLDLLPISFNTEDLTCSNIWLVPILKSYVVGSSLGFFMTHIVPLAKSLEQASRKVKKSAIGQDLRDNAHCCWGLLPAFCRHPTDVYQNFGQLAKMLIPLLKKDSFMLEDVSIALQELVNDNRSVHRSKLGTSEFAKFPKTCEGKVSAIECESKPVYSKKTASRNVRALASCSEELLWALTDAFLKSPSEKRARLKNAIGCLASITDSSIIRMLFISSLKRFELTDDLGECGNLVSDTNAFIDEDQSSSISMGKDTKRCLILELAFCIVEGASEDLNNLIFNFIRHALQDDNDIVQRESYHTLSRILEEHSWFCSSQFVELMDLFLGLKSPVDISSLRSRFACFEILLVHTIKRTSDEEIAKAFLILNEIILAQKNSKEEGRKAAYDILLRISSTLRNSSSTTDDGPYHKLISMIMGYLSGSSPHIKSGAVSALSLMVHNDTDVCYLIPDLVPSVLALLQSKAVEVIKAVLGFVKVLVSGLQAKDLQNFLSVMMNGVLPWSSISRHHFRSKVTVILEIMMRKCGSAAVKSLVPDKYKNFVKSVLENRHGKTNSKEAGTSVTESKSSYPSPMGWRQKRKHEESGCLPGDDDKMEPSNWKREKKQKGTASRPNELPISAGSVNHVKSLRKPRHIDHGKLKGGQLPGVKKNKKPNFSKDHSGKGSSKMESTKVSKKNKLNVHRPAAASKLSKQKTVGRKRQKISK